MTAPAACTHSALRKPIPLAAALRIVLVCTLPFGAAHFAQAADAPPTPASASTVVTIDQMEDCDRRVSPAARLDCYSQLTLDLRAQREKQVQAGKTPTPTATEIAARERPGKAIADVIEAHFDPSYVTLSSGKGFGGDQTNRKMLYEAQLFHSFSLGAKYTNDGWFKWHVDVPVRLGLRQLTEDSYPVRTPSYNPGLRFIVVPHGPSGSGMEFRQPGEQLTYFSLGLHHHSNGQEGVSKLPRTPSDGTANTRNGNFNTNYVEAAAHWFNKGNPVEWARLAVRQHFYKTFDEIQVNQYPKNEFIAELRSKDFHFLGERFPLELRLTERYGTGYRFIRDNELAPSTSTPARVSDKLHSTLEMFIKPHGGVLDSIALGFYFRYDIGYDYYNINFQNRINRLQIGLATK